MPRAPEHAQIFNIKNVSLLLNISENKTFKNDIKRNLKEFKKLVLYKLKTLFSFPDHVKHENLKYFRKLMHSFSGSSNTCFNPQSDTRSDNEK